METTENVAEVGKVNEVAAKSPEEIKGGEAPQAAQNTVFDNLESAAKVAVGQIRYCDQQVALWQERKQKFQTSLNETLGRIKSEFGVSAASPKSQSATSKPRAKGSKGAKGQTVPELIRSFLEGHGPARSREIRQFLLSKGKKTNPGVALGRMLKSGDLKSTARGTYEIK